MNADDTDIDIASDINSLLDYSNKSICFYCVCAAHGHGVDCISRLPWFCEKMRQLRLEDAARDMYTKMFQQDRPTYFRQLPWRLRRTMDEGLYDLASAGRSSTGFCFGTGLFLLLSGSHCNLKIISIFIKLVKVS